MQVQTDTIGHCISVCERHGGYFEPAITIKQCNISYIFHTYHETIKFLTCYKSSIINNYHFINQVIDTYAKLLKSGCVVAIGENVKPVILTTFAWVITIFKPVVACRMYTI